MIHSLSSSPAASSSGFNLRQKDRCEPAMLDSAITSTSSCSAISAIASGVCRKPV